jgi:hypothetical protein
VEDAGRRWVPMDAKYALEEKSNFLLMNASSILLLRWVFAYKLNSSGNLIKYKAHIAIRGDLQPYSSIHLSKNKGVATTFAVHGFRALMASTAAKNCDTAYLDTVSVYLNSNLNEIIYCEFPKNSKALIVHFSSFSWPSIGCAAQKSFGRTS